MKIKEFNSEFIQINISHVEKKINPKPIIVENNLLTKDNDDL